MSCLALERSVGSAGGGAVDNGPEVGDGCTVCLSRDRRDAAISERFVGLGWGRFVVGVEADISRKPQHFECQFCTKQGI